MNIHPESEQLSAFVDGELTTREQVALEAHVASCVECRRLLSALRATVQDLAALDQPEMDEQTSWAIRKAVARERRLGARSKRYGWAVGAAAASLIGILAFVLVTKSGSDGGAGPRGAADVALTGDFDERSAQAELDRLAGGVTSQFAPFSAGAGVRVPSPAPVQRNADASAEAAKAYTLDASADENAGADIARCERAIKTAGADIRLVHAIVGTYKKTPALLLFYEAPAERPERIELWVVRRDSCDVLLFQQKPL